MPLNIPGVPLKFFFIAHFVLVTWAALDLWLGECYIYSNYLVLIIGLWSIKEKNSLESLQFLLGIHVFTILNDIILLGMYFHTNARYRTGSLLTRFQFTAAMAILNLLLKPVSGLFMFREYHSRSAESTPYEDLGGGNQGPLPASKQQSAPPVYAPSSTGGYMPPTSANAPYPQGTY